MIITPARVTGSTEDSLPPSVPRASHRPAETVFPSYFAGETEISREGLLPDVPGSNAAELDFTSQLLPFPLARRVA
jgi:hypothetical protein